jgi:hypothetical protein
MHRPPPTGRAIRFSSSCIYHTRTSSFAEGLAFSVAHADFSTPAEQPLLLSPPVKSEATATGMIVNGHFHAFVIYATN